jgi:hypothetical protein
VKPFLSVLLVTEMTSAMLLPEPLIDGRRRQGSPNDERAERRGLTQATET